MTGGLTARDADAGEHASHVEAGLPPLTRGTDAGAARYPVPPPHPS
ncbi:hypothetical protein [Spirochaeta thermophila]|nr:hypothetical protein [Spirochaeta thermophila]